MDGRVEGPGVVLPMEAGRVAVVRVGRESAMEDGIRSRPGTPITTSEGSVLSSESQGTGGVSLEDGPDPGFAIGVTWLRCDGHVEDCITGMDTTGDGVADTPMSFQPLNVDLQRSIDVAGRLELARTADGARALLDGRELERAAGQRPEGVWAWDLSDGRVLVVVDTTLEGGSVRVDPLLLRPGGAAVATDEVEGRLTVGGERLPAVLLETDAVVGGALIVDESAQGQDAITMAGAEPVALEAGADDDIWVASSGDTDLWVAHRGDPSGPLVTVQGGGAIAVEQSATASTVVAAISPGGSEVRLVGASRVGDSGGAMNADGTGPHVVYFDVAQSASGLVGPDVGLSLDGGTTVDVPVVAVLSVADGSTQMESPALTATPRGDDTWDLVARLPEGSVGDPVLVPTQEGMTVQEPMGEVTESGGVRWWSLTLQAPGRDDIRDALAGLDTDGDGSVDLPLTVQGPTP
ncbi:hypothetical protein [Serinicoccus profundi]|uniref:hypothetical protein n=1 Tax=Serinicoccus profundi TaxID=1078471 RepID=UPI0011CBC4C2|nr:hypothetical protein [Serinicoccus profundi]